jgi:hypothetical protein
MASDGRDKLERKLAKARLKLRAADESLAATRIEGEQAVQRARLKAEKDLARARRELAHRVEKVARLERELHPEAASSQDGTVPTADQTADVLERVEQSVETQQPTLVIPS